MIITTPQTDIPIDISRHPNQDQPNLLPPPKDRTTKTIGRSRHPSQDQTDFLPPLIDRTNKTHSNLKHQPKIDYRLFIPRSNL